MKNKLIIKNYKKNQKILGEHMNLIQLKTLFIRSKKTVFLFFVLLLTNVFSFIVKADAGQEGNAGLVIECSAVDTGSDSQLYPTDGYYLMDYVMANQLGTLKDFKGWSTNLKARRNQDEIYEHTDYTIENLENLAGVYFPNENRKFLDYMKNNVWSAQSIHDKGGLTLTVTKSWGSTRHSLKKTEASSFELPHNCQLPFKQVVTKVQTKYIANQEILERMNLEQLALLYTHEVLRIAFPMSEDVIAWTQILNSDLLNPEYSAYCNFSAYDNKCHYGKKVVDIILQKTRLIDDNRKKAKKYREDMAYLRHDLYMMEEKEKSFNKVAETTRKELQDMKMELNTVVEQEQCSVIQEQLVQLKTRKDMLSNEDKKFSVLNGEINYYWIQPSEPDAYERNRANNLLTTIGYDLQKLTQLNNEVDSYGAILFGKYKKCER